MYSHLNAQRLKLAGKNRLP